MKKYLFLIIFGLLTLSAGCGKKAVSNPPAPSPAASTSPALGPSDKSPDVTITHTKTTDAKITVSDLSASHGYYMDYSAEALAGIKLGKAKLVLFFYSDSFAPCKTTDANLQLYPEKIPANTVVLKVDMNKQADLVKKYGVISPLEFVQIDSNDKVLNSWISDDLNLLAKNMK